MKRKIFGITAVFIVIITAFFAFAVIFLYANHSESAETERAGSYAVLLNEITVLTERLQENPNDPATLARLESAVVEMEKYYVSANISNEIMRLLIIDYIVCVIFAAVVFLFCYVKIIKPFIQLERFAKEVAKGNLDFTLDIQRENIFGEFSWAFDFMRSELKISRENEEMAKNENKALIAAISHDIKTPVSSIRAYAEALTSGMDSTPERRERYLSVIIKKADEVAKLTNDLFLHALSDMEKLQMEIKPYNAKDLIGEILDPFFAEYGSKIKITTEIPSVIISADEKRLSQVFENIIVNAVKYAPDSNIELAFKTEDDALLCELRDFGGGIPPRDMPFILNRFYRGENAKNISGSGLGLYIVKYIIEKCGGFVSLNNSENGLTVTFSLPIKNNLTS